MSAWRLLPFDTGSSELHFALSDALVRLSPRASVWWHTTESPTLILGAGQRHVDVSRAVRDGIRVVYRSAGGTAVYAGPGVLGQDVFLPRDHPLNSTDVVETYRWLGEVWLQALAELGIHGKMVSIEAARAQPPVDPGVGMACFGRLSPYEVTVEGRKLVGLAQVRRSHGTLLQAGIHLHFDAPGIASVLPHAEPGRLAAQLTRAAAGLEDVASRPLSLSEVMSIVNTVLAQHTGEPLVPARWSDQELKWADDAVPEIET